MAACCCPWTNGVGWGSLAEGWLLPVGGPMGTGWDSLAARFLVLPGFRWGRMGVAGRPGWPVLPGVQSNGHGARQHPYGGRRAAAAAGSLNGGGWDSLAEPLVLLATAADGLMELAGEKWDVGGLRLYE